MAHITLEDEEIDVDQTVAEVHAQLRAAKEGNPQQGVPSSAIFPPDFAFFTRGDEEIFVNPSKVQSVVD